MTRILPGLLLIGCSSTAIQVTEQEGECTLAGGIFAPTILEQGPPEDTCTADYRFDYHGQNCNVSVMGTCPIDGSTQ